MNQDYGSCSQRIGLGLVERGVRSRALSEQTRNFQIFHQEELDLSGRGQLGPQVMVKNSRTTFGRVEVEGGV